MGSGPPVCSRCNMAMAVTRTPSGWACPGCGRAPDKDTPCLFDLDFESQDLVDACACAFTGEPPWRGAPWEANP